MTGLLDGLRIVSFAQWLFGPAATQYLADMGADVVKVERPGDGAFERSWAGGDTYLNGVSAFFMLANRNVRSVALDLNSEAGLAAAHQLVNDADVVISNFRPSVMERFALDYDSVRESNPSIVYAIGTGYGRSNPQRDLPGQDLLIQAVSGLADATGRKDEAPRPVGAAVADQHSAALLAMGVLGALVKRAQTGEGQLVEVTMVEAAFDLQVEPLLYTLNGGHVEKPSRPVGSPFHQAPYGVYETEDGWIALSMSPLQVVLEALGDADDTQRIGDMDRLKDREKIYEVLSGLIRPLTTDGAVRQLREHGVWCAPIHNYETALADPLIAHLDPIMTIDHPDAGEVQLLRHPVRYSGWDSPVRLMPPRVGEHTGEVLAELGLSEEEILAVQASDGAEER